MPVVKDTYIRRPKKQLKISRLLLEITESDLFLTKEEEEVRLTDFMRQGISNHKRNDKEIVEDIGENATFVELKNSGHSPLIDDLDQLLKAIQSFLQAKEEFA
ncbi:MAG: alpha/beta fold hydrolase [Bacillota bacterium]